MFTPPVAPVHNWFVNALDRGILAGGISAHDQQVQMQQLQQYQGQRLNQIYATLPDDQKQAFAMDPKGYMDAIEKGYEPITAKGGETVIRPQMSGGNVTAPLLGMTKDSVGYSQTPTATTNTGAVPTIQSAPAGTTVSPMAPVGPVVAGPPPGAPMIGSAATSAPMPGATAPGPAPAPGAPMAPQAVANGIFTAATGAGLKADDARNLVAIAKLESGLNPNVKSNGRSTGLFQFQPTTFKAVGGNNINDPAEQTAAAIKLYQQNKQLLGASGLPVTPTSLYLAHQQGFPAAKALMSSDPNKNAVQTLVDAGIYRDPATARKAIVNNFGSADMTNGQFLQTWQGKVARRLQDVGGVGEAQAASAAPPAQPPQIGRGAPAPAQGMPTSIQGKLARDLTPQEVAAKGYAPGTIVSLAPDGTEAVKQEGYTPTVLKGLKENVTGAKQYQDYTESNDAYKAMLSTAALKPGGMRAYALRDTFARVINPGAVARAGTIEAIKQAQGVPANIQAYFGKLTGDGDVPPAIAQQILDVAQGFARSHYSTARSLNDSNTQLAQRKGLDARDITAPMDAEPPRVKIGLPPKGQVQPGVVYITPKGAHLYNGKGFVPYGG